MRFARGTFHLFRVAPVSTWTTLRPLWCHGIRLPIPTLQSRPRSEKSPSKLAEQAKRSYFTHYKLQPEDFFELGKVFSTVDHNEVDGMAALSPQNSRNYVVVDEADNLGFCFCLRYENSSPQVWRKAATQQSDHVILQKEGLTPLKLPEAQPMIRDPLSIRLHAGSRFLKRARLDLTSGHRINVNRRVREIGDVTPTDLIRLLQYRKETHDRGQKRWLENYEGTKIRGI